MPIYTLTYNSDTNDMAGPPGFMLPLELVGTRIGVTNNGAVEFSRLMDPATGLINQALIPDVTSGIRASVDVLTTSVTSINLRVVTLETNALNAAQLAAIRAASSASGQNRFATMNDTLAAGAGAVAEATEEVLGTVKYANTVTAQMGSGSGVVRAKDTLVRGITDLNASQGYGALIIGKASLPSGTIGSRAVWISPIGSPGECSGDNAINVGYWAIVTGAAAIGIGSDARAQGTGSVALGTSAHAFGDCGLALGRNARANGLRSSAIGADAKATKPYMMLLGVVDPNTDTTGTGTGTTEPGTGGGGSGLLSGITMHGEVGTVALTFRMSDSNMVAVSKSAGEVAAGELNKKQFSIRSNLAGTGAVLEMNVNGTIKTVFLPFS